MHAMEWIAQLGAMLESTNARVQGNTVSLPQGLEAAADVIRAVRQRQGAIWWVGNGGSAALCSHLSQDMLNKLGIASHTLSDHALLTCMANDFGYEEIYVRPLRTYLRADDLLIAVSSSGKSANILRCVELAQHRGTACLTLSAFAADNPLWALNTDVALYMPCTLYGHAEVGHEALLHAVIETVWLDDQRGVALKVSSLVNTSCPPHDSTAACSSRMPPVMSSSTLR